MQGEDGNIVIARSDIKEDAEKCGRMTDHVWGMHYDEFDDNDIEKVASYDGKNI